MTWNNCLSCHKKILPSDRQREVDALRKKFCNSRCAAIFNNGKRERPQNPDSKAAKCLRCEQKFLLKKNPAGGYYRRVYCDNCLRFVRLEKTGKNTQKPGDRTKESLFSSRKTWQSARTTIRKHAADVLSQLQIEKKCFICGYSNHVEICHKKAVKDFPGNVTVSEINSAENLIYLCPNHHWELDNGLFFLIPGLGVAPSNSKAYETSERTVAQSPVSQI